MDEEGGLTLDLKWNELFLYWYSTRRMERGKQRERDLCSKTLINPLIKFKPFSLSFSRGTKPDLQTDNFHGGNVILSLSVLSLFQMKSKKIRPFHFAEHYFQLVFNRCSIR